MRLSRPMAGKVGGGDIGDSLGIDADDLGGISKRKFCSRGLRLHGGAAAPLAMEQEAPWWAGWS